MSPSRVLVPKVPLVTVRAMVGGELAILPATLPREARRLAARAEDDLRAAHPLLAREVAVD
jgi:hypothetical protein